LVKTTSAALAKIIDPPITTKIENATKGLTPSYSRRLGTLSPKQISVICDYVLALRSEIKLSYRYRQSILNTLMTLSRCVSKSRFRDFTRADAL
jgi:hypothetical protein